MMLRSTEPVSLVRWSVRFCHLGETLLGSVVVELNSKCLLRLSWSNVTRQHRCRHEEKDDPNDGGEKRNTDLIVQHFQSLCIFPFLAKDLVILRGGRTHDENDDESTQRVV